MVKETNEEIKVIIRGVIFKGFSWDDLYRQIQREVDFYRKKLYSDTTNAMLMQSGSGFYGKWNTGIIMMNNARKNLEALESFLEK